MQTRQDINVIDIVARFQDDFIKENDISHHYAYELNRSSFVKLVDQLAQLLVVRKASGCAQRPHPFAVERKAPFC